MEPIKILGFNSKSQNIQRLNAHGYLRSDVPGSYHVLSLIFFLVYHFLLLRAAPITASARPCSRPSRPFSYKHVSRTFRLTLWTLPTIPASASIVAISTRIVPPNPTLSVVAPYAKRNNLLTSLTIPDPDDLPPILVFFGRLVVRFFEVSAEFHERAWSQGIVTRFGLLEEGLRDECLQDLICLGYCYSRISAGLGVVCIAVDLALSAVCLTLSVPA